MVLDARASGRAQPAAVSCLWGVEGRSCKREQQPLHNMDRAIGAVFFVVLWGSGLISSVLISPKARNRERLRIKLS